jgi:hypothetical protein
MLVRPRRPFLFEISNEIVRPEDYGESTGEATKYLEVSRITVLCFCEHCLCVHTSFNVDPSLTKGREHLQEHVNRLTNVAKIAKENANREQDNLKSENGFLRK